MGLVSIMVHVGADAGTQGRVDIARSLALASTPAFDGDGIVLDWVLEMQRFSQGDLFDRLAEARRLTPDLTDVIVGFHAAAEVTRNHGGRAAIEETIVGNHANLLQSCSLLDCYQVQQLTSASMLRLSTIGSVLDTRRDEGWVRRCHGDLHLGNICLFQGRPTPFDCIEFSDDISRIDVLYDLAFLLMDLVRRDLNALANIVFNRYLDFTADLSGLAALSLFMSVRAAVRAHVLVARSRQHPSIRTSSDARSYLSLATRLLGPHPPCLIAIGGFSGVGKSTLAEVLAPDFAPAPGARLIRSDVLRKCLFNVPPETRLPPSALKLRRQNTSIVLCMIKPQDRWPPVTPRSSTRPSSERTSVRALPLAQRSMASHSLDFG
jgi:uncharacterized protein